jgi:hypothetical protein
MSLKITYQNLMRIITVSIILILPLVPSKARAASQKPTITISPFLRDVSFSSSEQTKSFPITITNNSSSEIISLHLSIIDFGSLNDSGGIVFAGSNLSNIIEKYGLANWLQLSTDSVTLDPGQKTDITATIIDDDTLKPGGHYAAVIATVDKPDPSLSDQISINQKLSTLILAKKIGGEKYNLNLNAITPQNGKMHLPKSVVLNFKNPGNVHIVPRGTVKIISPSGKLISKGIINEESSFVLPETSRQLLVDMKEQSSAGIWPAFYNVQVDYRYDGIAQYAHKEQLLYFVNLPGILLIVFIVSILGLFAWRYRDHLKKLAVEAKKHKNIIKNKKHQKSKKHE